MERDITDSPAHGPPRACCSGRTCCSGRNRSRVCRSRCPAVKPLNPFGFTLLELLIVIAVIAVMLALVFPRFSDIGRSYLESDSERVVSLLGYLNESASTKKAFYRVRFDLGAGSLIVERSKDGVEYSKETESALSHLELKEGVLLEEIEAPGIGKVKSGEVAIIFSPAGGDPFEVTLKSGEERVKVGFNPYTGKVKKVSEVKDE